MKITIDLEQMKRMPKGSPSIIDYLRKRFRRMQTDEMIVSCAEIRKHLGIEFAQQRRCFIALEQMGIVETSRTRTRPPQRMVRNLTIK